MGSLAQNVTDARVQYAVRGLSKKEKQTFVLLSQIIRGLAGDSALYKNRLNQVPEDSVQASASPTFEGDVNVAEEEENEEEQRKGEKEEGTEREKEEGTNEGMEKEQNQKEQLEAQQN